jgi:tetratricopeptide (TPR) repeat protein
VTGQSLLQAHRYREAQAAFRRAIAEKDHTAFSYAGLGTASIDLGDYVGGFKAYQQAVRLLPNNAAMNYYAAYAALDANAYTWTVTYAKRSLKLHPNYFPSYHLLFLAYGRLKDKKNQVTSARMEARLLPGSADSWNDLGIALGNDAQLRESITAFTRAIQMRPKYWAYYKNRAIIEVYNKQPNQAIADLQRAQALAPDPADKKLLAATITRLKKALHH